MNATPSININPANTIQPASSGKSQDASADVPFKQVLSSEMAQKQSGNSSREGTDVNSREAGSVNSSSTDSSATAPAQAQAADADTPANHTQTETIPVMPDMLLALVVPQNMLKTAPAGARGSLAEGNLSMDADATAPGRKGRAALLRSGQFAAESAGANKAAELPVGKAKPQAAVALATTTTANIQAATSATAFSGQLAAAQQADALKIKELPTELMNPAGIRSSTQASFDLPTIESLASNKLAPSVGTTAWNQALGDKVVWMAAGAQQTATLTLNPPNMGPLQIVLNITNDQATASFFSAQPEVRQALEAAFPKLRDMMNEAGIQLEQATVSADTPRQNDASDRQAQRATEPFGVTDDGVSMGQTTPHAVIQHSGRGLVDTFA